MVLSVPAYIKEQKSLQLIQQLRNQSQIPVREKNKKKTLKLQFPGRTLLLSTHFMDEADLLGDRIAIMAGGELQCCGSSFFLKKKYGAGYHLVMDKSPQCDPEKVTTLLRKYISNIEVHSCIGSELTYLLAESQSYIFETMLRELEQHSYHLGINSYGISLTTLEEVFMKVGADHGQEEIYNAKSDEKELNGNAPTAVDIIEFKSPTPTTSSLVLLQNQITAMSLKKILSTMRSWVLLLIQIFMPVIFLAIAIVVARQQNNVGNLPALLLDTSTFDNPVTLVENSNGSSSYSETYRNIVGSAYEAVPSIEEEILNLTARTPVTVRRRYIGGLSISNISNKSQLIDGWPQLTTYFNNDPYHTPAITLGLTLNTMYRTVANCSECSMKFRNAPMPYLPETQVLKLSLGKRGRLTRPFL
ncbi:ATP-binding cassette sub-family A member 17-like, partial [Dendroctonus ponderosae]|uniref:ATP-binding cassette sub-family A member 17-like n=1 Tax=Dendroctonus ponderosae TaxID=77166 RepID=UPI00203634B3